MSGCCPVNSSPFLAPTYTNIGKISKLPSSDVEAYISSSEYVAGSPAVILFPDAFGWNTGRIRAVSDLFASEGYYSLVPKIMQPCVEGAQDGDGYPADGDMPGMGQFFSTLPYQGVLKPRVDSIIAHLQSLGVAKICLVGFWYVGFFCPSCCYPLTVTQPPILPSFSLSSLFSLFSVLLPKLGRLAGVSSPR